MRVITNGSSDTIVHIFKKTYERYGIPKKITAFFDNENFLLTGYQLENYSTNLIVEYPNSTEWHLSTNCGYAGAGSHATAEILNLLGVSKEKAEEMSEYRGFTVTFEKEGQYFTDPITPFFAGECDAYKNPPFVFNEYSMVDVVNRKITLINPHINCFSGLLSAIQIMKPQSLEIYTGKDSPIDNGYSFVKPLCWSEDYKKSAGVEGINLALYGEKFDIYCLIDRSVRLSVINAIFLAVTKRPYFHEFPINNGFICQTQNPTFYSILKSLYPVKRRYIRLGINQLNNEHEDLLYFQQVFLF